MDRESLFKLVGELREAMKSVTPDETVKAEIEAELVTLEAQAKSPKPKRDIVVATLKSIGSIGMGIGANLLTAPVRAYLVAHGIAWV